MSRSLRADVALPIMRAIDVTFIGAISNGRGRAKAAITARTFAEVRGVLFVTQGWLFVCAEYCSFFLHIVVVVPSDGCISAMPADL